MIKAVLFDLDNTLIDFVKMKLECCRASVKAMIKAGLLLDEEKAYSKLLEVYTPSFFEDNRIFQKFLKTTIGRVDYRMLSAAIVAYRAISSHLDPYPGTVETLKKLKTKGIELGVVSDAPKLKGWIRLSSAGLAEYFPIVVTLGDSKVRKPSTVPFKRALKELKLEPGEVLFVGDNLKRDIVGAKKAGMKTALAEYGDFKKIAPSCDDERPDYVLKTINDVLTVF